MAEASTYIVINAILNAVAAGLRYQELQARVAQEQANGTPPEELPAKIKQWRDLAMAQLGQTIADAKKP